jgi:molybdopterin synthase catalytic subunit/MOSC domain-containing protein YiiM
MPADIRFFLTAEPIEAASLATVLYNPAAGAVVTFDGRVRDHNVGRRVTALAYSAYPAMAEKIGRAIVEEECLRHGAIAAAAAHRTGKLAIGEVVVLVVAAAAHREAAFAAARAITERLKYELPVWKKEYYIDGDSDWIGPDGSDPASSEALPRWETALEAIYISPGHDFRGRHGLGRLDHGMLPLAEVECLAGRGLKGDRYAEREPGHKGQVTFFDAATVDAVRALHQQPDIPASAFRRNLIVRGVNPGDWIGRRFLFQGIVFEGSEECRPCYWMDETIAPGTEEFLRADCRGGLRARILTNGILRADP